MSAISKEPMKLLFAHERFGAFAGAESNILVTAAELKKRGHDVAILHGPPTGKGEAAWRRTFEQRFALESNPAAEIEKACQTFRPDAVYVHKLTSLDALESFLELGIPVIRMVHDHDLYCMRSYK